MEADVHLESRGVGVGSQEGARFVTVTCPNFLGEVTEKAAIGVLVHTADSAADSRTSAVSTGVCRMLSASVGLG